MTICRAPLKRLAVLNPETLPDWTDSDYPFHYIDIATTGRGYLREEPEFMTFGAAPSRARRVLRSGDTILSTVRTYLRAAWTVRDTADKFIASTGFVCLRPRNGVDARFLGWLAQSNTVIEDIVARSVGVSYPAISPAEVGRIEVPWPSLTHQHAIADYLDRETARIDSLISARRKTMLLLDERLRATISLRVIERGGPLVALSRVCECLPGYAFPSNDMKVGLIDGVPLLRGVNVGVGGLDWTDIVYYPPDEICAFARYQLRVGDLVIGMDRPVIKGGIRVAEIGDTDVPAFLVQRVARIRANSRTTNSYIKYVLTSAAFTDHVSPVMTGVSVPHISSEQILSFRFPLPDLATQSQVVEELEQLEIACRSVKASTGKQIDLLQERRQALITAAVTGQIDIPESA
jgi:type I restriction enzyme, S subunit